MKRMRHVLDELLEGNINPAQVLKGLRLERKISQEDLADITGLQRTTISALENDRMPMTARYANIFAVVFSVKPQDILYPNGLVEKSKELQKIKKKAEDFFKREAAG